MSSGLICNPKINWIVFHGSYDFGYLLKLMSGEILPINVQDFFISIKAYFPKIYDIKHIIRNIGYLKGGLSKLA